MKKVGILCCAFLLSTANVVFADVYYATPPTVYVRPDPSYETGQAIGNILGNLIQGLSNQASEAQRQKQIKETQNNLQEIAVEEARFMKTMIESGRMEELLHAMEKFIYATEMCTPVKDARDGIFSMSYIKDIGDGVKMYREYAINTNTDQVRCVIRVSPYGIDVASVENITLPEPQPAQMTLTQAVGQYLGIVTSTEKTPEGGFTILEVVPNGLSDFAGVKPGDILTKIDTYDLKEHDIDRVAAYIALRYRQKQVIRATVLRDSKQQVIQIQL